MKLFIALLFAATLCAQPQPAKPNPPFAPGPKPARRVIINSLADVPAQAAGAISIDLDANSMTALEAARTAAGLPDVATLIDQVVQRAVQDAMRRYPPADIFAAQQTLMQRFQAHLAASAAAVKVTTAPAKPAAPAKVP